MESYHRPLEEGEGGRGGLWGKVWGRGKGQNKVDAEGKYTDMGADTGFQAETREGSTLDESGHIPTDKEIEVDLESDIIIPASNNSRVVRTIMRVTLICALFMVIELVGGYYANSVAVISDALHLAIDIIGYIVQIASAKLAMKSRLN